MAHEGGINGVEGGEGEIRVILSVVMPTCNKRELLARSLTALMAQELDADWEIVVVNDGSQDGTDIYLAEQSRRPPGRLRVVSPGRNVGRAAARNLGLRAALGHWILFLDDDIVAPPGLLASHLQRLQSRPGWATIGCVRTDPDLVDGPYFHYLDTRGVAKVTNDWVPARYFVTQNAAVPRDALLAVGGFDERFSAYGLEDMEMAFRLEDQQGVTFLPVREPVPLHVHHHTLNQYLDKKRECGHDSLPLLARLHPHRIQEMRLHWIIDSQQMPAPNFTARLVRKLARGAVARLVSQLVSNWLVRGGQKPVFESIYYRGMDALVLCALHQGVSEKLAKPDK